MTTRPKILATLATLAISTIALCAPVAAATSAAKPSDFNGDGRADLAIGSPGEAIGAKGDAGAVSVLYGSSSSGLTATGDDLWSQDASGVQGTSEGRPGKAAGDGFGTALASGDFDRDGRADLAIGVPLDRVGDVSFAGAVNVLYGSSSGLTATGDQLWSQGNLAGDPATGDGFGQTLASGDFDGDGYWDLAVGIPGEDHGDSEATGTVTIISGGADGLTATDEIDLTRASTGAPYESDTPHGFGYALAAGDIDGDGYADLAVGLPASGSSGDDPTRDQVNGEVNIFYGSADGIVTSGTQLWTQDSTDVPGDGEPGDWFGASLTIGDFDHDGFSDLAVGVPFDRVSGVIAGSVNVLYGTADGLSATDAQLWDQDTVGVPGTAESDDFLGAALADGDLDGDSFADLAIGAPGEAIGSGENGAGLVNVIYGSATGLDAAGSQSWSQASSGVPGTPEATDIAWDAFGASLAIGDFGRSSQADLAIGVPLERLDDHAEAGMVNVLYGKSTGLSGSSAQGWSQDSSGVQGSAETRDYFGAALTP